MAKAPKGGKKKKASKSPVEDYYKLKTEAVEDLATADETNSPEVSKAELERYGGGRGGSIPNALKVYFIKFWFPAAVCYFFLIGLGMFVPSFLDLMFITVIALGIVTDILTNNALRFFASTPGAHDRYMMFPKKRYMTFFWNILYAAVLMAMVIAIYNVLNIVVIAIFHLPQNSVPVGVEPILFGIFYVLCDSLLIWLKHLVAKRFAQAKNKNVQEG